jgi:hypothetical protein
MIPKASEGNTAVKLFVLCKSYATGPTVNGSGTPTRILFNTLDIVMVLPGLISSKGQFFSTWL